jgi:hypothetical protein
MLDASLSRRNERRLMPKSYVGASWGPRSASVDDCANRLAHLLTELATISPLLSGWRALGKSKRQPSAQPLVTTYHADLVTRLLEGRHRRDDNRAAMGCPALPDGQSVANAVPLQQTPANRGPAQHPARTTLADQWPADASSEETTAAKDRPAQGDSPRRHRQRHLDLRRGTRQRRRHQHTWPEGMTPLHVV